MGKVAAVTQIVSQASAERAKHVQMSTRSRPFGPTDRQQEHLDPGSERAVLERMAESPDLGAQSQRSDRWLTGSPAQS